MSQGGSNLWLNSTIKVRPNKQIPAELPSSAIIEIGWACEHHKAATYCR